MMKFVQVLLLLVIIGGAGYWIYQYGDGKYWNVPASDDVSAKIMYRGRLLRDWMKDLESEKVEVRRESADALINIPPKDGQYAIAALSKAVGDKDNLTRARATMALGRIMAEAGIPAPPESIVKTSNLLEVTEVLHDPDPQVRATGALALGSFGSRLKDAGPALAEVAKNDQDEHVRKTATVALEQVQPSPPKAPAKEANEAKKTPEPTKAKTPEKAKSPSETKKG